MDKTELRSTNLHELNSLKISAKSKVLLLIPAYNDWKSVAILLPQLNQCCADNNTQASVLIVDDGSDSQPGELLSDLALEFIVEIEILRLRANLGHQRAIAVALPFIANKKPSIPVVVLDADGEDKAEDVFRLLAENKRQNSTSVIFAKREGRSESFLFRFCYKCYLLFFYLFVGARFSSGNFSLIPPEVLPRLTVLPDLWNHYAVTVFKSKVPVAFVECDRGVRVEGQSKMNFIGLVIHGLSAISVFAERLGARLFVASTSLFVLAVLAATVALIIRFTTSLAIPGWTTYTVGLSLVIALQALTMSIAFVFLILSGRHNTTFLPERDYQYFILSTYHL